MTDKSTILRAFNNHFFEFFDDIIRIFPENREMKDSKTAFEVIKKANPTAIIKGWKLFIYDKYNDMFEEGNLDYFFDKDYAEDLHYLSNANEIMRVISVIRGPIREMTEESKAASLEYLRNLCKLSNLYN